MAPPLAAPSRGDLFADKIRDDRGHFHAALSFRVLVDSCPMFLLGTTLNEVCIKQPSMGVHDSGVG